MKKLLVFILLIIVPAVIVSIFFYYKAYENYTAISVSGKTIIYSPPGGGKTTDKSKEVYVAYAGSELLGEYETYDEAYDAAKQHEYAGVKVKGGINFIWDNYPPYSVYTSLSHFEEFGTLAEALDFAKKHDRAFLYQRKNSLLLWDNVDGLPDSFMIENVKLINQMPELERGCEVTSLAMLIDYFSIKADKMKLAYEVKKNAEPNGDPNEGFIGDMESFKKPGLGVYHKPIYELLSSYFPDSAVDLTGAEFDVIYYFIAKNQPVWVIINATYKELEPEYFHTWKTSNGDIKITYAMHAVLITGYDKEYIYFNDPLGKKSSAPANEFIAAWVQIGKQAVSIVR